MISTRPAFSRLLLSVTAALVLVALAPSVASAESFTKRTLHFDTVVGPNNDQHCDVIGDLYKPAGASAATPAPAILTTNGFGGSKDDQADLATYAASHGYVVLSYSGLGFGGSGCKIQLDDPDYDGKAASQLVTFLGGGSTAKDGTRVNYVIHDRVGHDGKPHAADPRVGMIGGSYGGEVQFAVAGIDPRVDALVPLITWNDLAYSLAPNNTDIISGVTSATPGVAKYQWALFFSGEGIADGIQGVSVDPSRITGGCPNFDPRVCPALVKVAASGAPDATTLALLRHASVSTYIDRIHVPTLLIQGEHDTLFNLNEAAATYQSLRARGVPTALIFQSWGHSRSTPAPGEYNEKDPPTGYTSGLALQWLEHYLGRPEIPTLKGFCFFRDWIQYTGLAQPAYACASDYPLPDRVRFYPSGANALSSSAGSVAAGRATFATTAAGAPTSYSELSAINDTVTPAGPPTDVPGAFAGFTSAPLTSDLDVAGSPIARLRIDAPLAGLSAAAGPSGDVVLFPKIYDVAPDGSRTLPSNIVAPIRIADPTKPFTVALPGIVHRFAAGHRVELVVAGGDAAYRGNVVAQPVSVITGGGDPSTLDLPVATSSTVGPAPALSSQVSRPIRHGRAGRLVTSPSRVGRLGRRVCTSRSFVARVVGSSQAIRVNFHLDGHRLFTDRHAPFMVRISGRRLSAGHHILTAQVVFARSSHTRARSLRIRYRGCRRHVAVARPRFTG